MTTRIVESILRRVPDRYENVAKQFIKFGVTGTMGAVIDFTSYNIMTRGFDWTTIYTVYGYKLIAANLVSVLLAISIMFFVNKYWTFRNTASNVVQQGAGYFAMNSITFVLNQILTSFFAFHVPFIEAAFGGMKDNVAKALAIGFILFVNFFGSKFVIFRKKQPVQADQYTN